MFQNIPLSWIGVDSDRWQILNDYFRQNIDEILNSGRVAEMGEWYVYSGTTYYDIDALVTLGTGLNIQLLEWEAIWIPEDVTQLYIGIQSTSSDTSVNSFYRCILTNFTTGTTYQIDINNLPAGPTWVSGLFTGLSNNDYFNLKIYYYNNTGSNQTVRFRQIRIYANV